MISIAKRVRSFLLVSFVLVSITHLSACGIFFGKEGYFRDRSNDYLKTGSIPPTKVGDDVDTSALGQLYVVPEIDRQDIEYPEEFRVPRPQLLSSGVYSEKVKIQKLGEESWIYVNISPSEVWPRARFFLNSNNMSVASTDAQQGLIETSWLQFKNDDSTRHKYLLKMEQGVQPDSTEIHVLHISMSRSNSIPESVTWPEHSMDKERESWMIQELSASLADEVGAGSASLLAQTIGGGRKISFVTVNSEPKLRMNLDLNRSRATLTYALRQEGFVTFEFDSNSDLYYINYKEPESEKGFFGRLFSGSEDETFLLADILSHMALDDTPSNRLLFPAIVFDKSQEQLEKVPGYLVILSDKGDAIEITLRDPYGLALPSRDTRYLLGVIRRNLI